MVLGAVSDYAAVHCGYVGHHCAVWKAASFCGIKSAACDSRCIDCEYAAVDRLPVLLQRLSRFLLSLWLYSRNFRRRFFGVSVPAVRDCSVWPVFRAGCHPIWEKRNEVKLWKRKNFNQLVSLRSLWASYRWRLLPHRFCTFRCRTETEPLGLGPMSFLSCWAWFFRWYVCGAGKAAALSILYQLQSAFFGCCWWWELLRLPCSLLSFSEETVMRRVGKFIGCCLIAVSLLACTACSISIG